MKKTLFFAAALIAGILLSMEAAIGGALGENIGELEASLFVFAIGAVILVPSALFLQKQKFTTALKRPKWELTGGFLGAFYLVLLLISVNMIGVGVSMVAVIIGQIFISIVIDHFGWIGIPEMKFDRNRLTATVLLIGALFLIV
ncbi:DMT family transporter [Siminovitchia acidinfaciens]|uniref:DMT family transporter n=1 Tax=Siminovitchia acidinfaciens TaxID=2321395 RepID=A0A429XVX7_9BACI|nr:DMT family transporter [Siminovitchia acidinfaciens]RST72522.1 DMT family transporter [Siminovitchia acidinfaciens]